MKKYENFCNAYRNLKDIYSYEEPYNNVELTGLVGLYEICFEQAWKMMKEKLTESGFAESATGSPRTILKTAYKAGMIVDEQSWLDALQARNNVAHAYNEAVALDIIHQTKESFYDLFGKLKNEIEERHRSCNKNLQTASDGKIHSQNMNHAKQHRWNDNRHLTIPFFP